MSSAEFNLSFDNALDIIRMKYSQCDGLEKVLSDFGRRVATDQQSPIDNRSLFIDPDEDAQRLLVSRDTVSKVLLELRKLKIVHLWVRVSCPNTEIGDESTIIETDKKDEFEEAIFGVCPHCGGNHDDVSWECIETVYAFHFDLKKDPIRLRDFFRDPPDFHRSINKSHSSKRIWETVGRCLRKVGTLISKRTISVSPSEEVSRSLDFNGPIRTVSSPAQLCWVILGRSGCWFILMSFIFAVLYMFVSPVAACLIGICFVLIHSFALWICFRAVLAMSSGTSGLLGVGTIFIMSLLFRASGFMIMQEWNGQGLGPGKIEFGKTDLNYLMSAIVAFLVLISWVGAIQWRRSLSS